MFNGDVITGDPDRAPRAQDKKKGRLEEIMNIYGVCCDVSGGGESPRNRINWDQKGAPWELRNDRGRRTRPHEYMNQLHLSNVSRRTIQLRCRTKLSNK